MNIVIGEPGRGEAVLIRAIEPDEGLETIKNRRADVSEKNLTDGPGKLCQALNINGDDNGADINGSRFSLEPSIITERRKVIATRTEK